jgi:hypothetical protein
MKKFEFGKKKFGFGSREKHPGSATLLSKQLFPVEVPTKQQILTVYNKDIW